MGDIEDWVMNLEFNQAFEEDWYDDHNPPEIKEQSACSKGLRMSYPYSITGIKHSELREEVTWRTKDGRDILIKDITDDHLHNIIAFQREYGYDNGLAIMVNEENYRANNNLKELKERLNPDYYDGFY